jgi:serine/threonine protein phosphatase PrpC
LFVMATGQFAHVVEIAATSRNGEDRARMFAPEGGIVIALADGAGGTGNGARAAQAIVDTAGASSLTTDWCALLDDLDQDGTRLGHGQSTAVLLSISELGISGASVGDSGAWVITGADVVDLTAGQHRKPLVGDGCFPFRVTAPPLVGGTLLVASDGLLRYAKQPDIARIANGPDLRAAARELIDLVRLPNGSLQDDVAIVLCRHVA